MGWINNLESTPQVTVTSKVILVNGGNLALVELCVENDGYYSFVVNQITISNPTGSGYWSIQPKGPYYTTFSNYSLLKNYEVNLPYPVPPGKHQLLYTFCSVNQQLNGVSLPFFLIGNVTIVKVFGTLGSTSIVIQSSASEVGA
ncbi:hypothetical protein HS7_16340 [Sulfolobales archaeon HS-7]|nr:hypothetical protein HS7_16340 [Sulfolobales archaeon HS-7]